VRVHIVGKAHARFDRHSIGNINSVHKYFLCVLAVHLHENNVCGLENTNFAKKTFKVHVFENDTVIISV